MPRRRQRTLGLYFLFLCTVTNILFSCGQSNPGISDPSVIVLGIAQDGGYPQAGCEKACCLTVWEEPSKQRYVSSIGIADPQENKFWLVDATPDFRHQLRIMQELQPDSELGGILLTHGHMGYSTDLPHQQRLRDVLGLHIGDGTRQIQKMIIARAMVGSAAR